MQIRAVTLGSQKKQVCHFGSLILAKIRLVGPERRGAFPSSVG
jgi:hypothetical protein